MKFNLTLLITFVVSLLISCSEIEDEVDNNDTNSIGDFTVWNGDPILFEKLDGADPNDAENQDRITSDVWITRGNDGGQIYNIAKETIADSNNSPIGTEWAIGNIDDIESLTFSKFRSTVVEPKNVVGLDLVLHLIEEDVYLSIKFSSWSKKKNGGFAYTRSTSN